MKLRHILLATAALAGLASSCSRSDGGRADGSIEFSRLSGRAAYVLTGSAKDFSRDSDVTYFDSACIIMPERIYNLDMRELRDSIVATAFDTLTDPQRAMEAYFLQNAGEEGYELRAVSTDSVNDTNSTGLTLVDGSVICLNASVLSYQVSKYIYAPCDANGVTANRYFSVSLKDGQLLRLGDIFTPEGIKALPPVIAERARQMVNTVGPTTISALPANDNFYISASGAIVFAYQPYEAASYSQGEIKIPFFDYQLSDYMTPQGLQLFGLAE